MCVHFLSLVRYGGTKLERARELFEQATLKCPPDAAAEIFLKYAKLEEEHGLVRRAMAVYDRATKAVAETQRLALFRLYIKKAESFFGVTRTREIHEQAIKTLPDLDAQVQRRDLLARLRPARMFCSQACPPFSPLSNSLHFPRAP